ncbi:hypothetical protein M011DRAFT_477773 [Sporormia fimetaria CBS 119925]|uniref:Ankyrin n=1 Tax=Sporormia fimetaria CBS 119925 TaxID=1340428 RepID=A0A6A6V8I8_9PLEO|nr:hypothetical protein M011DRAFT_477773 [Sporormia fimetaria CBS 119925]
MQFLDLPAEVVSIILRHAIVARGITRGLRLRLVNKMFAEEVLFAIHNERLLGITIGSLDWGRRWSPNFVLSHIEFRVNQEREDHNPYINCIRDIAKEILDDKETEASSVTSLEQVLHQICLPLAVRTEPREFKDFKEFLDRSDPISNAEYNQLLLAASTITNCASIVERCIRHDPTLVGVGERPPVPLYGPFVEIAAQYAEEAVLHLLLTIVSVDDFWQFRQNLLLNIAYFGRADAYRSVNTFRRDDTGPEDDTVYDRIALSIAKYASSLELVEYCRSLCTCDHVDCLEQTWTYTQRENMLIRSIEDCQCVGLASLLLQLHCKESAGGLAPGLEKALELASEKGYRELVELLLNHGGDTDRAMSGAAAYGHIDLVRMLLERGASPRFALLEGAIGGYFDIVKLALSVGGAKELDGNHWRLLARAAIAYENAAMFGTFIEHGMVLDKVAGRECAWMAKEQGLDSMLDLLEEHGVEANVPEPRKKESFGTYWQLKYGFKGGEWAD